MREIAFTLLVLVGLCLVQPPVVGADEPQVDETGILDRWRDDCDPDGGRIFLRPRDNGVQEVVFDGGIIQAFSLAYTLFKYAVYAVVAISVAFCLLCLALFFSMIGSGFNMVFSLFNKKKTE